MIRVISIYMESAHPEEGELKINFDGKDHGECYDKDDHLDEDDHFHEESSDDDDKYGNHQESTQNRESSK